MNSKQECIAKAYGNYDFGQDKNGWSSLDHVSEETDLSLFDAKNGMDNDTGIGFVLVRPKSLQGIENNNGWIKIESEDDLPENGYFEVIKRLDGSSSRATLSKEFGGKRQVKSYSHYQEIKNLSPPLH